MRGSDFPASSKRCTLARVVHTTKDNDLDTFVPAPCRSPVLNNGYLCDIPFSVDASISRSALVPIVADSACSDCLK